MIKSYTAIKQKDGSNLEKIMKKEVTDQNNTYVSEPGEEYLAILIKEAGVEARARKKQAMAIHFQKLHAAVCDKPVSTKQAPPL